MRSGASDPMQSLLPSPTARPQADPCFLSPASSLRCAVLPSPAPPSQTARQPDSQHAMPYVCADRPLAVVRNSHESRSWLPSASQPGEASGGNHSLAVRPVSPRRSPLHPEQGQPKECPRAERLPLRPPSARIADVNAEYVHWQSARAGEIHTYTRIRRKREREAGGERETEG